MTYYVDTEGASYTEEGIHLPRHIGPFPSLVAADTWAASNIYNGSWSIDTAVNPDLVEGLRQSARGETVALGSFVEFAPQPSEPEFGVGNE